MAKSSTAECAYLWISTLDTTPLVTLMLSPPVGKPTQTTSSSRAGTLPNSSGQRSSQKVSSATPNYNITNNLYIMRFMNGQHTLTSVERPLDTLWNLHKVQLFSAFISYLHDISSWKCSWKCKSLQFERKTNWYEGQYSTLTLLDHY